MPIFKRRGCTFQKNYILGKQIAFLIPPSPPPVFKEADH